VSTLVIRPARTQAAAFSLHRLLVSLFTAALLAVILYVAVRGFSYYRLPLTERPFHPLHQQLRPAGETGIRLGVLSGILFLAIYVYPLRKRWKWLGRIGSTRHWLDFHIVMGLAAPVVVTLHSAFKFQGLAGMAYWIMMAVVASGVAGRYLYAQIPRSKSAAELTLAELEQMSADLSQELQGQNLVSDRDLQPLLVSARRDEVRRMSLWMALWQMLTLDLRRPFQMAALRRHGLTPSERLMTLGGLLASSHQDLERTVAVARRHSWLTAKISFLERAGEVFELWHVVHRPFSYAFLVLAVIHVGMITLLGYF
jgi:hypothetical protein